MHRYRDSKLWSRAGPTYKLSVIPTLPPPSPSTSTIQASSLEFLIPLLNPTSQRLNWIPPPKPKMPSFSKIVLFFSASAFVNAAVIPREEPKSNVYKLLEADPNITEVPDLSIRLVEPTTTDVRGNVADITDLDVDVIPAEEERFAITAATEDTDRLMFSVSITSFLSSKAARIPSNLDWTDDGCSLSPDEPSGYNFLHSCQRHDFGYRNFKAEGRFTDANRLRIDNNFKTDLYNECNKHTGLSDDWCRTIADTYYTAVRTFGGL